MKIGFNLPILGQPAKPQSIVKVAKRAEELGYDSLWVFERLLFPVQLQSPYPATPDGSLPEVYKGGWLDPLQTLNFAAASTSRIRVGTSILDMPYYNPVVLARGLTTLDILSGGRLQVGFGQGWSKDEMDATGVSPKQRAARADEFLQLLKAIWTTDPVEFRGKFFQLPKSYILPKPVQKPHPPIYLAAYGPGSMKRVATLANGWNPVGVPIDGMAQMMEGIRGMAKQAGRNPSELKLIVRANLHVTAQPLGEKRWIFTGSTDEIKSDIQATKKLGADEIIFDPSFEPAGASVEGFLKRLEEVRNWVA